MSKRVTKLFKVLIGQIAEDGGVDVILGKALHVLGHAELSSQSAICCITVDPYHRNVTCASTPPVTWNISRPAGVVVSIA
jgi:hypothetical protein